MAEVQLVRRKSGTVTLHVAEAGPSDGPPVVLLHGFPEFWFGWRHQIDALARAGLRVIVPDQRGYNLSDKPKGVANYDLDKLAGDIVGLMDCYGVQEFALVGHDWGASVSWWLAQNFPRRIRRLAVLNAPHPALWRIAMDEDPEQKKLSRYVRVLGIPIVPEAIVRAGRYKGLSDPVSETTRPLSADDMALYRAAWTRPGALTAMINWYRALLRRRFERPTRGSLAMPVQIIWGAKDKYASLALAEQSLELCNRGNLTVLPQATHWVQHDEADTVNAMLLEFLS